MVLIDGVRVDKTNQLLDSLDCNIKDRIKLKKILDSLENENVEQGSIYELISQKTNKDQSTIKKFMAKITDKVDEELLKELGINEKPKGKELLIQMYKKINKKEVDNSDR